MDKKISQLTAAAPLTGTEQLPLVQGGVTLKASAQNVANLAPVPDATKINALTSATTPLAGTEQVIITQGGSSKKTTAQDIADLAGGGIGGTNYIYVMADGTDTANAAELSAAYTAAQALSPSATNRITIVCGPGKYNFGSTAFTMSTQYIDLVSLDGNRSIIFNSSNSGGTISITANDVFVKGVDVQAKNFIIATNLNLLKVENCKGGDSSFGSDTSFGSNPLTVNGTFINCQGGDASFGDFGFVFGIFTNCVGGVNSFGASGMASGIFTNCVGGVNSFGAAYGTADGTFIDCISGGYSFGAGGYAIGTFTNCQSGDYSFGTALGSIGAAGGIFTNCIGGLSSFGGNFGTATGTFTSCIAEGGSFGGFGIASGTFTNCVSGHDSYGGGGTLSGKLYYCRLTSGTFQTVSGGGRTYYCVDGNGNTNNQ